MRKTPAQAGKQIRVNTVENARVGQRLSEDARGRQGEVGNELEREGAKVRGE